ncbi:MAG: pilus assembly protein PilX, partial [Gammaproteobacteria bacterium]
ALLVIGITAARVSLDEERAVRAERDRVIALQAAEAALHDAEREIEGGRDPVRAALFASGSAEGFAPQCGRQREINAGLCLPAGPHITPVWLATPLAEDSDDSSSVAYGRFTGATMPVGHGGLPQRLPRYLIELMPFARAGEDASARTGNFYRITAVGFGAQDQTRVVLQSFYLKAAAEGAP